MLPQTFIFTTTCCPQLFNLISISRLLHLIIDRFECATDDAAFDDSYYLDNYIVSACSLVDHLPTLLLALQLASSRVAVIFSLVSSLRNHNSAKAINWRAAYKSQPRMQIDVVTYTTCVWRTLHGKLKFRSVSAARLF